MGQPNIIFQSSTTKTIHALYWIVPPVDVPVCLPRKWPLLATIEVIIMGKASEARFYCGRGRITWDIWLHKLVVWCGQISTEVDNSMISVIELIFLCFKEQGFKKLITYKPLSGTFPKPTSWRSSYRWYCRQKEAIRRFACDWLVLSERSYVRTCSDNACIRKNWFSSFWAFSEGVLCRQGYCSIGNATQTNYWLFEYKIHCLQNE